MYASRVTGYNFKIKIVYLSLKIVFVKLKANRVEYDEILHHDAAAFHMGLHCLLGVGLTNSADPDKMPHLTAFYLGLHCLPKYLFIDIQYEVKR